MEDFRNLVTGPNCEVDDGGPRTNFRNPLAKFADVMYRDRSQKEQQEFNSNNNHVHMEMPHEPVLNTQMQRQVERFLDQFDKPSTMDPLGPYAQLNVDEFDEFAHEQGRHQDPRFPVEAFNQMKISEEIPSELLKQYFKALIHTAQTQEPFMPLDLCELPLSDTDKLKIRNRTTTLARHMFTNQNEQFVEEQLSKFLDSFESHHHGPEKHAFNHDNMANEFLRDHNQPIPEEHFDKYFHEAREAEAMAREFQEHQFREFDQHYHEAHNVDGWVDEFEGRRSMRPIQNLHDVTSSITNIQDPKLQQTNFVKFLTRLNNGELELVDNGVVETQRNVDFNSTEMSPEAWYQEFNEMKNQGRLDNNDINLDSTEMSPEAWFQEFQKFQGSNYPRPDMEEFNEEEWLKEFSVFGNQDYLKNYMFTPAEDNPYMSHPDPLNKGIELFQDGKISESILAFEAELQQNPQNSPAWQLLGQAQAESDKDTQAIAALLKAVETDPENRPARLALAVSYTNDLFRDEALECLRNWMESHPEYRHIKIQMPNFHMGYSFDAYHQAISDMFLEAARLRPDSPDPDVQTALGLLYNLSVDYDKAVDCFKAALSMRPDDYLLWNKLGATLANSNRSDEAIGCYYRALKIKPSYVRARANLGISFMALKNFPKAAQYFLGALSLHPDAIHIWNNLQMVFMSMDREDLVDKAVQRDIELFRNEFEF